MDFNNIHYKSWTSVIRKDAPELCGFCNNNKIGDCCNKCGEGVCLQEQCCMIFPDRKNTTHIICLQCQRQIENKLKVEIDYTKLRDLKKKNKTKNLFSYDRVYESRLVLITYKYSFTGLYSSVRL